MRIDHIAMYVNDLDAAQAFFVNYFGARSNAGYHNPNTNFRSYFLSFDGGARLELMHRRTMTDTPKDLSRTGYAHICISVGSPEAVDELTARLKADGFTVHSGPRTTGDGYYESCVIGIEDNLVEITV
jgi:lactoylglutathione lyase